MSDRRKETIEAIGPFSVYLSMLEAHLEASEQGPLEDKDTILYFMGSGASHRVTVADLRRLVSLGQCTCRGYDYECPTHGHIALQDDQT